MKRYVGIFLFAVIMAVSCANKPVVIANDLTPAELIQRGQEASDRGRFKIAIQYYTTLIERFPFDIDNILAAEYEMAFIHYKQKKYDMAKIEFTNILERYNIPDEELLPPSFKILSTNILKKIAEIESSSKNKKNRQKSSNSEAE